MALLRKISWPPGPRAERRGGIVIRIIIPGPRASQELKNNAEQWNIFKINTRNSVSCTPTNGKPQKNKKDEASKKKKKDIRGFLPLVLQEDGEFGWALPPPKAGERSSAPALRLSQAPGAAGPRGKPNGKNKREEGPRPLLQLPSAKRPRESCWEQDEGLAPAVLPRPGSPNPLRTTGPALPGPKSCVAPEHGSGAQMKGKGLCAGLCVCVCGWKGFINLSPGQEISCAF